jgi:hypothetical protein
VLREPPGLLPQSLELPLHQLLDGATWVARDFGDVRPRWVAGIRDGLWFITGTRFVTVIRLGAVTPARRSASPRTSA